MLQTEKFRTKQRLYLSEQTDGTAGHPNTLIMCEVQVINPRVAAAEHMMFDEDKRSPFVKKTKTIVHPVGAAVQARPHPGLKAPPQGFPKFDFLLKITTNSAFNLNSLVAERMHCAAPTTRAR